jgi:class 3 adenylate cyclase
VRTPTALVVGHADAPAEREEAEYVASLMPNATVRVLQGRSGLQTDEQMAIIRELAGIEQVSAVSTVLATVLFTDIVDSTSKQAELGDRRWRNLVLEHHATVRGALSHWEGTEHDTAGNGFFASFVGPARAIHCAHEIAAKGLQPRHRDTSRSPHRRMRGYRRQAGRNRGHDAGEHELKGIPGSWHLYRATAS